MRFSTNYNYHNQGIEKQSNKVSDTIPGQSSTIKSIIQRFQAGQISPDVFQNNEDTDENDPGLPMDSDLVDIQKNEIEKVKQSLLKQKELKKQEMLKKAQKTALEQQTTKTDTTITKEVDNGNKDIKTDK